MAGRREQIRMTPEEVAAFLAAGRSLQVATLRRDGSPHLTTLWYALDDDAIVFWTYSKSQKIKNLDRDPRMAVLLEDGEAYGELRGVSIEGRAELSDDPAEVARCGRLLVARNNPQVPAEQIDQVVATTGAKRTIVRLVPERTISWDHRKLGDRY